MTHDALGIAGSGMSANRRWLDATADNLTNLNTVTATSEAAFQARYLDVAPMQGGGVTVTQAVLGPAEGRLVHEPDHPLADDEGYVRYPEIDMSTQMTHLIMAQHAYQANTAVVDRAKTISEAAIQIGAK